LKLEQDANERPASNRFQHESSLVRYVLSLISAITGALTRILGFVAPGFESVKDQFLVQLRDGKGTDVEEIGASFAAFHKGECVVCLFGGYADQAKTKLFDKVRSPGSVVNTLGCVLSRQKPAVILTKVLC
jgi:hypothetical protein